MPNSVLNQLKALRDGVAQDLRKDPRYLTLQALDKSIEEISTVLTGAGLLPASAPASSLTQRLGALAPQPNPYAEPAAVLGTDADAASQSAASPEHGESPARPTPGFKDGTTGFPHPAVPHHVLPPLSEPALEIAEAAEVIHGQPRQEITAHFEAPAFEPENITVEAAPDYAHAEAGLEPLAHAGAADEIETVAATHETHAVSGEAAPEPETEAASWHSATMEPHASTSEAEAEVPAETHETEEAGVEASADDSSAYEHHASETLFSETLATAIAAALLRQETTLEPAEDSGAADLDAAAPLHPTDEARAETLAQSHDIEETPRNEWPEQGETDSAAVSALSALAAALFQEEAGLAPAEHAESSAHNEAGAEAGDAGYEHYEAQAEAEHAEPAAPIDSLTAHLEAALEEWAAEAAALEGGEHSGAEAAGEMSAPHALDAGEALADASEPAFETTAAFESIVADAIAAALFPDEAAHETDEHLETEVAGIASTAHAPTMEEALEEALEKAEEAELAFDAIVADAIAAALFPEETAAEHAQHFETEAPGATDTHGTEVPGEAAHGEAEEHAFETALAEAAAAHLSSDDEAAHAEPATDEAVSEAREDAEAPASHGSEEHLEEPATAVFPEGKASGYIPMAAKAGAPQYSPSIAVKFGKLPGRVDLRPLLAPIEDQGQTNSSVAHAVASAYEYWIRKATKKPQNISRQFVYYNARWRAGEQDSDGGSAIQLALEGLQKFGACAESAWPSNPQLLAKRPGAEAYREGAPYRIHDMAQVPLKLEAWKQALAEGKPVIFGLALFDSFADCANTGGVVPMPAPDDVAHKGHREHAMCAVGYSEPERVFIVRNSWGEAFGDKGYCYIPFDYLLNPKFNDGDNWIFVPKVPSQPPRETWQDSQTPITNGGKGVDFPIEPYRIEDYAAVSADLFEQSRRPWNANAAEDYSDYAGKVGKSLFDDLEPFDVTSFLAVSGDHADSGSPSESEENATHGSAAGVDDGEWGNAAAWGVSTAMDHGNDPAKHEASESETAHAELTHSLQ